MSDGYILGKDGKYYKTPAEAARANSVVDTQKNIENQLIQQNNMLKQQNENDYRIAMENAKIAQENMAIQKEQMELEKKKLQEQKEQRYFQEYLQGKNFENEKELRLLKLFDDIAIPYECFMKFKTELLKYKLTDTEKQKLENSIFDSNISDKEKEEYKVILPLAMNQIDEKLTKSSKYPLAIRDDLIEDKIKKSLKFNDYKSTKEYSHLKKFIETHDYNTFKELLVSDFDILTDKQEAINTYNEAKGWKQRMKNLAIFSGVVGLFILFGAGSFWTWLIFIFSLFATFSQIAYRYDRIMTLYATIHCDFKEKEEEKTRYINEKIDRINEIYKKLRMEHINKSLQKLYDFRINHYNMSIENIFYSSGLISECEDDGLYFPNIDRNNIIKEGTVEDYFFYFNNYSSDNEMQNS